MNDRELGRRIREARVRLLVCVAALDDTPPHDVGRWLMDLGEALVKGTDLPIVDSVEPPAHRKLPFPFPLE